MNAIENAKAKARAIRKLRNACTATKITLSAAHENSIIVDCLYGDEDFAYDVDRATFIGLIEALFVKCRRCMEDALRGA